MSDLISLAPRLPYIIVGFFTPNYRRLADAFAANLASYNQPHHLYAVSDADWSKAILLKPQIVLRAMTQYPSQTIIFMDVDCTVHGDLSGHATGSADVAFHIRAWQKPGSTRINSVSRLVVFRPTEGARRLALAWAAACSAPKARNDESQLMVACSNTPGVTIEMIPKAAAPEDYGNVHHPLVHHKSAHTHLLRHRSITNWLKMARRALVSKVVGKPYKEWKINRV